MRRPRKVSPHERRGARHQQPDDMTAIGQIDTDSAELDELPEFELCFLFDDQDDPNEVTIFHPGADERGATRWITMDNDFAVPLDQLR